MVNNHTDQAAKTTRLMIFSWYCITIAETSGGLLIALPAANAEAFCAEIEQIDGAYHFQVLLFVRKHQQYYYISLALLVALL